MNLARFFLSAGLILTVVLAQSSKNDHRNLPRGTTIPAYTVSPNGRYGVTIPHFEHDERLITDNENRLIDLTTSRTLCTIRQRMPAYDRGLNHHSLETPIWSSDSSLLLWHIDGKWFPNSYVLIRIKDGKVRWQRDILKLSQEAILTRTRKASPEQYAAAKKSNAGNGSAYPDGFTVDVFTSGPLSMPVKIRAVLTSNPKGIPDNLQLDSYLDAVIRADGSFHVPNFELGKADSPHF